MTYKERVLLERPMSEGDQIKAAIREVFETARQGTVYSISDPLRRKVTGVNGVAEKVLCLGKYMDKPGAIVLWYE